MDIHRYILLSILLPLVVCYEMVKLRSLNDGWPKTSSTLKWQQMKIDDKIPPHAVPVHLQSDSNSYWCRAMIRGTHVPGSTSEKGCEIAFFSTYIEKNYDILMSVNDSARIKFVEWDSLVAKPENAVLSPDRYLMLVHSPKDESKFISANLGTRSSDRKAFALMNDKIYKFGKGRIMVEDEPVSYKLQNISFDEKYTTVSQYNLEMKESQLFNLGDKPKKVSSQIGYTIPETIYYGRPKGTLSALKSLIIAPDTTEYELQWGMQAELKRVQMSNIQYELPPHSGVNVTIIGNMQKFESPYSGVLFTIFGDGFIAERIITSLHTSDILEAAVAKYSSPFYLNGSLIGIPERSELIFEKTTTTTTTTPTTTTSTSTTPPTTTTTTEASTTQAEPKTSSLEVRSPSESRPPKLTIVFPNSRRNEPESLQREYEEMPERRRMDHSTSTSDRIISALSTMFTSLIFWYFSLGVTA